jgi:pimeloyl-ACP methyl ester carboxylesterase
MTAFVKKGAFKHFMNIFLWICVIYSAYCLILFLLQRSMIFPRYMIPEIDTEEQQTPLLEKIQLSLHFGKVEAWYLSPVETHDPAPRPVVIFAHGNAELIDFCVQELMPFTQWGIGVLLVEFPGYGRSEGRPSEKTIAETFATAYDTITRRTEVDSDRVILYGRSLGGGAVCALLKERPAAALILMSTFTSIRSFAKRYLAPSFLIRDPFDNLETIEKYNGPVLIFHGKHDEVIPYHHGKSIYQSTPNGKFISYQCGHNDCPPDYPHFWSEIKIFLESAGLLKPKK